MSDDTPQLQLFLAHRAALVDYAAPIVGGRAAAEDVVQEAYIRFDRPQERAITHPVGYLYRIVRNLAIDWSRRRAMEASLPDAETAQILHPRAPSAEQAIQSRAELRILARALSELPERTRIAFEMHRIDGNTLQQVADRLDISVVRVHQLVRDAVVHCARRLDDGKNSQAE